MNTIDATEHRPGVEGIWLCITRALSYTFSLFTVCFRELFFLSFLFLSFWFWLYGRDLDAVLQVLVG